MEYTDSYHTVTIINVQVGFPVLYEYVQIEFRIKSQHSFLDSQYFDLFSLHQVDYKIVMNIFPPKFNKTTNHRKCLLLSNRIKSCYHTIYIKLISQKLIIMMKLESLYVHGKHLEHRH